MRIKPRHPTFKSGLNPIKSVLCRRCTRGARSFSVPRRALPVPRRARMARAQTAQMAPRAACAPGCWLSSACYPQVKRFKTFTSSQTVISSETVISSKTFTSVSRPLHLLRPLYLQCVNKMPQVPLIILLADVSL